MHTANGSLDSLLYLLAASSWSCQYGKMCYKYFPTEIIWKDAKDKCEEIGGQLVRITSTAVAEYVGKLISTNIWIALNDVAEPGNEKFLELKHCASLRSMKRLESIAP